VKITPPLGFGPVRPYNSSDFIRLPAFGSVPAFAQTTNVLPISSAELSRVCLSYPVVFVQGQGQQALSLVAVLGLQAGQNLFFDTNSQSWDSYSYLPNYLLHWPFCLVTVQFPDTPANTVEPNLLMCVETACSGAQSKPGYVRVSDAVADAAIAPWREIESQLLKYDAELKQTKTFVDVLQEHQLLESVEMLAHLPGVASLRMAGMQIVSQQRLAALSGAAIVELQRGGHLAAIHAHLSSLHQFDQLTKRHRTQAA